MSLNKEWIQNAAELATTENRKAALCIATAALDAIDTQKVVSAAITLDGNTLSIQGKKIDLGKFKKIKIVGFGKASCEAAHALEQVMGPKIHEGVVIGLNAIKCDIIETFAGSHPKPSAGNVEIGQRIADIASDSTEDDLVIAIVSGGGSALLCQSADECDQENRLYDKFIPQGKNITELNTVRKHISTLKGGGLAKLAYPATLIGLIFSDVPGDRFQDVASGPTYKDVSTVQDAQAIIDRYDLGEYALTETPKEDMFFEKVTNFVLVSNHTAVAAMQKAATDLGFATDIIGTELYDESGVVLQKIFDRKKPGTVVIAAGEPVVLGDKTGGRGGRCLYMGLNALNRVGDDSVFIPLASDGIDNSPAAGAIVDSQTVIKAQVQGLDALDYLRRFDALTFFEKTADVIFTGPTNANVSDLMFLLTAKK